MKGSPVRGQQRVSIGRLNESRDVQGFQAEVVRLVGSELKLAEVFFGFLDGDSKELQLPSWVNAHLERHPGLLNKLEQGEMVGISYAEENPVLRPAPAARSNVILIPIVNNESLHAAIGLVSPLDGQQPTAEEIESVRLLIYEALPILLRLQEIDQLRRQNHELMQRAQRTAQIDAEIATLREETNALNVVIQMRAHLQANVAHDLRTPLAAIRGYARMILDGRGGEINDTQRDYLRVVTDNTNRLINLVSWMSYVAELSAQHLKLSTFDLQEVWRENVAAAQDMLQAKNLTIAQQIPDDRFVITGDREKFAYVFRELIAAAAMFSDKEGTITAEFSRGREREVTIKISEKGASIPDALLNKIFERSFNTISKPVLQSADAGAISLSGVYDIVGMHGGRVFVNSTAGQGATFLFTLPAVTADGEENSHEQAVNSGRRRR